MDKLTQIIMYQVHLTMNGIQTKCNSGDCYKEGTSLYYDIVYILQATIDGEKSRLKEYFSTGDGNKCKVSSMYWRTYTSV